MRLAINIGVNENGYSIMVENLSCEVNREEALDTLLQMIAAQSDRDTIFEDAGDLKVASFLVEL